MEPVSYRIDPREVVLPTEDPAEFESLSADYYRQFAPVDQVESSLVDMLIYDVWIQRRVHRYRAELFRTDHPGAAREIDHTTKRLEMLARGHAQVLKELQAMQRRRQNKSKRGKPARRGQMVAFLVPAQPRRIPASTTATGEWIN